jgi:hypothetical protein
MNIMSLGDIDTKNEETTDTAAYCWVRMARDSEFSFSKIYGAAARIVLSNLNRWRGRLGIRNFNSRPNNNHNLLES